MRFLPSSSSSIPSLFLSLLPLTAVLADDNHAAVFDVAIVGGGLAGLSAAKDLVAAGKSVVVLEARDRVGGRVHDAQVAGGGVTEVGAEFIGPTQDRIIALAASLGLETFPTFTNGSNILYMDGSATTYTDDESGALPIDIDSLTDLAVAIGAIDAIALELDVTAPWNHPQAREWDGMTFQSWINATVQTPTARLLFETFTTSVFSTEPAELSLLYTAAYIAAAGNETVPGSLARLIGTANGAQDRRLKGGMAQIPLTLAARLGSSVVRLNSPVRRVSKDSYANTYTVSGDNNLSIRASSVVIAMSPPLAARIIYEPALPASRDQLTQRMAMGALGKAIAIYPTPFWRAAGLNAQVISDEGTTRAVFDSSPSDGSFGALMGFLEADTMRTLDALSDAAIQAAVTADYVRYFGPQAANVSSFIIQRWDNEVYSRGGPVAYAPPTVLTRYGPALTRPVGSIYFAGTETSPFWTGYMDGAVRSGEAAAKAILGAGAAGAAK